MIESNLVMAFEKSIKANWKQKAFTNYKKEGVLYSEVAERIYWIDYLFKKIKIKKGDKISIAGKNSVNWAIAYIATVCYGAVIVPILSDFHSKDIQHIINHSDSILLFSSEQIAEKIEFNKLKNLHAVISLDDFKLLEYKKKSFVNLFDKTFSDYKEIYHDKLNGSGFILKKINNDEVASIVYTSGTTGFSKGVVLTHNSLIGNVKFALDNLNLKSGANIVSFLPIAHCYACAFDFLYPFANGCHITFLNKIPSPKVIIEAFKYIKPDLIISVPLVMEKIYKKKIKPKLNSLPLKLFSSIPGLESIINKKIKKSLIESFGGSFYEVIIGGASLNLEVEEFLKRINFPFTIGYGMTECGPLICYSDHSIHKLGSVGKIIDHMEVKIDSDNPEEEVGEILVRGEHLLIGYYKDKEATKKAIDKDGWLHTGDLGIIDSQGFVYIRGRSKTMILGSSGQNIYPEEIESRLNNMKFIQESLVIERNGKLVALVYPDMELVDIEKKDQTIIESIMDKYRKELNNNLPSYSKITRIELYPEEFIKTPKKSIKRFLYR